MPVKPPRAASDADIDSWLKKEPHPDTPIATPSAPREPEPSELGYGQQISRGARKSAASLGIDAARFGNQVLGISAPGLSRRLGELASQSPTAQRLTKFADEPYQTVAEGIGGVGTDIAAFALQPEMGIERGALWAAGKYGPPAAKFVKAAGQAGKFVPTKFGIASKAGAQIAEGAGKGAVAGAITDPDDPKTGAISGAIGGGLPPALGGPAGKAILGTVGSRAPHAITAAVAHALNIPYHYLAYGLPALLHGSHRGRQLGELVYEYLGRHLSYIPPGAAGAAASQTATRAGLSSTGIPWNVQGYGTIPTQQSLPADSAYRDENDPASQQPEPRQEGGPVQAGQPYMVGERGPEIMVPQQGGQVMPHPQGDEQMQPDIPSQEQIAARRAEEGALANPQGPYALASRLAPSGIPWEQYRRSGNVEYGGAPPDFYPPPNAPTAQPQFNPLARTAGYNDLLGLLRQVYGGQ